MADFSLAVRRAASRDRAASCPRQRGRARGSWARPVAPGFSEARRSVCRSVLRPPAM